MSTPFLLGIMGPTASGKSDLAEAVSDLLGSADVQLINADAFQMYRGFDVGTGKPARASEYALMSQLEPGDQYGVGAFVRDARALLFDLFESGKSAIVVGGTGLYIRALFENYSAMQGQPDEAIRQQLMEEETALGLPALADRLQKIAPEIAARTDLRNGVRVRRALERIHSPANAVDSSEQSSLPAFRKFKIALVPAKEAQNNRIAIRVEMMLKRGWIEEVRSLVKSGWTGDEPAFRAIGYRQILEFIEKGGDEQELANVITLRTVQYAKRQRTWLRSEPNLLSQPGFTPEEVLRLVKDN